MKFFAVLLPLFIYFQVAAQQCIYANEKKIMMPPQRDQGATGFCYGFAATALLQTHYCKSKPKGECTYEEDSLSVLDVIAQGNYGDGGLIHGGNSERMLESISRSKKVSLDSCAPFSPFLNSSSNWKNEVKSAKAKFDSCRDNTIAEQLKTQLKLKTTSQEILFALGYRDYSIMLSKIFIPKECENRKVKISPFSTAKQNIKDFSLYKEKLIELLNQDRPAIAGVCSFTTTRQDIDCSNSLHALVISGYRKKCCANKCEIQFQMYDSLRLHTFNKDEISTDGWVSEATVKNRFESYNQANGGSNLIWIENK